MIKTAGHFTPGSIFYMTPAMLTILSWRWMLTWCRSRHDLTSHARSQLIGHGTVSTLKVYVCSNGFLNDILDYLYHSVVLNGIFKLPLSVPLSPAEIIEWSNGTEWYWMVFNGNHWLFFVRAVDTILSHMLVLRWPSDPTAWCATQPLVLSWPSVFPLPLITFKATPAGHVMHSLIDDHPSSCYP